MSEASRLSALASGNWHLVLEVVPAQRERHAPGAAAATHQLRPFDGADAALAVLQVLVTGEQVHRADYPEPGVLELTEGRFVAGVRHRDARAHREEVARRRPLLPLLQGPGRPAAEHRLEGLIHRLHGREEVRHFLHALRLLAAMQNRQTLGADEVRG